MKSTPTTTKPSQQEIEQLAYSIYQERGGQPGHALDDWLEAEKRASGGRLSSVHEAFDAATAVADDWRPSGASRRRTTAM